MFRRLSALPDDWTVLHSLGLARHAHKPWSEIDFTLVGPLGVLLIEVKGGVVHRRDAEWLVRTQAGDVRSLGRGPFFQVGGAEAATRRFLEQRLPWLSEVTFGYLVATPDCRLEVDDLGVDQRCLYDARRVGTPIVDLMDEVFSHWRNRMGRTAGLADDDIVEVVRQLVGDIPAAPDLANELDLLDQRMAQLTDEQRRAVHDLAETRAVWLAGPAGSGKTLLAVSETRRLARQGRRVAYVCHTRGLALHVGDLLSNDPDIRVILRSALDDGKLREGSGPVDALVVDEAQDMMDVEFAELAEHLLVGGLSNGVWRCFVDPNQSLFGRMDSVAVERWLSTGAAVQRLSRNCRSTAAISLTVSALTGVPYAGGVEGAPRPALRYEAPHDTASAVLDRVGELRALGLPAEQIVVLTPRKLESSVLASMADRFVDFRADDPGDRIDHATVGAFKGLERRAVVFAGIDELDSLWIRQQLYVGCTRATGLLSVILRPEHERTVADGYARAALSMADSTQEW